MPGELELQKLAIKAANEVDVATGVEMDDMDIGDIAGFGAPAGEEPRGPAWSESSDGHRAESGGQ
eukprot:9407899-Alexandrium_andersonii.AAC.1